MGTVMTALIHPRRSRLTADLPTQALSGLLERRREVERQAGVEDATRRLLLYAALPTWIGAGLVDWWHHRRTDIEHTAGTRESLIHSLMMGEAGAPVLLGLFADVNAGVLATALAGLGAHEATAVWDVAYAESRRNVTPAEQHIHSLLEVVPMAATAALVALHWDQAAALVGLSRTKRDLRLRPKRDPLPTGVKAGVVAGIVLFGALPYAEELRRCLRVDRSPRSRPPAPGAATPTTRIPQRRT
jgi:hypothetical protein